MSNTTLSHPHDQALLLTPKDLTILSQVKQIIQEAKTARDPRVALAYGASMLRAGRAVGVGLALLTYELREAWAESEDDGGFGQDPEDFLDATAAALCLSPQTISKYADTWKWVLKDHPGLMSKPMESLMLVVAASKEDQLEDDDWKRIEKAPDKGSIREVIQEKRGGNTSSIKAIHIILERDGRLQARQGNRPYVPVGMLTIKSSDEVALAAIERIINAAGIVRR